MKRILLVLFAMLIFGLVAVTAVSAHNPGPPGVVAVAAVDVLQPDLTRDTEALVALVVVLAVLTMTIGSRLGGRGRYASRGTGNLRGVVAPWAPPNPLRARRSVPTAAT